MPDVHRQKKSGALIFVPTEVEVSSLETLKAVKETKKEIESELEAIKKLRKQLEKDLSD